jgi:hypothetical protein
MVTDGYVARGLREKKGKEKGEGVLAHLKAFEMAERRLSSSVNKQRCSYD